MVPDNCSDCEALDPAAFDDKANDHEDSCGASTGIENPSRETASETGSRCAPDEVAPPSSEKIHSIKVWLIVKCISLVVRNRIARYTHLATELPGDQ